MGRYLIRRAIVSVFTLLAISFIIYAVLFMAPGDPLGEEAEVAEGEESAEGAESEGEEEGGEED